MKRLILAFIGILTILAFSCENRNTPATGKKIIVGVFNGNGTSPICVLETMEALKIDKDIQPVEISAADIVAGKLDELDVLIFPGGSGSKELNNLGNIGAKLVKDFVRKKGKGIVGICAGAYLLSTTPTYPSLQLISAKNIDRAHYSRGRGLIQVKLTEQGEKFFPELKGEKVFLQYYDGPILAALDSASIPYIELAKYVTDIHSNPGTPVGITPGKTFMLLEQVGQGKILACAGHPEATPGYRWMIPRMARLVSDGKIRQYPQKWIRPQLYKSELMFTPENKKLEKQLFWKLLNDTPAVRIAAIKQLFYDLHSRPAVRWSIGLLRDSVSQVRQTAALILKDAEYTWAVNDLRQALKMEKDSATATVIKQALDFLTTF